ETAGKNWARADDIELEAPPLAQTLLGIVAGGGAADQKFAAAFEAAQGRVPGVTAGEVDHHVDAALVAAPLRLAVCLHRPFREIDLFDVYHLIGAELLELSHLFRAPRRGRGCWGRMTRPGRTPPLAPRMSTRSPALTVAWVISMRCAVP